MANNIKGITVEIGGDTTKLSTAIKDVNKETYTLQSELSQINRQLKFNPSSTELLAQKQKVLRESVDATKQKLEQLKSVESQVKQQFESGELGADKFRAFEREIEQTESKLKGLQKQANEFGSVAGQKFQLAGEKINAVGDKISGAGQKFLPVSAAAAGVGTAAVKMASDFETSGNKVSTIADTTQVSMDTLEKGVLDLSTKTGESADDLNDALYQTISAGVQTKDAVSVLGTAVETAKGGFTDTTTAVDTITTALNSYGMKASEAKHVSDLLIQTQNLGKTTVGELGQSLGNVIPTASAAGVSFTDLMGSIAELTKQGLPTSEAITGMKAALSNVIKPSSDAADEAEKLGINFSQAHLKSVGWAQFLSEIKEKTGGNVTTMGKLFGSVEALNSVTVLAGKGSKDFAQVLSQMGKSAGTTDSAFGKMEKGTGASFERSMNSMKNAAIQLGTALAPVAQKIAQVIQQIAQKLQSLSPAQQQLIAKVLLATAALAPLIIGVGKVVSGFGALSSGVGTLMTHFGAFTNVLKSGGGISSALTALLTPGGKVIAIIALIAAAIGIIVTAVKHLWDTNAGFRNAVITIWNGIKTFFSALGTFFKTIFNGIVTAVKSVVTFFRTLPQFFSGLWTTITTALQNFWNSVVSFFTQGIPNFMNQVKNWFMHLPENLGYALGFAIGKLVKFGADAIAWAAQAIPKLINSIGTFFSQLPGKIWNFLTQAIQKIQQWGSNCISYVTSNFPKFVSSVVKFFQELPGKIWTELGKVVTNIGKWIGNIVSYVSSNFPKVVDKIVGFFKSIPGKMLDIGGNIVRGIWSGISGAAGWLWQQITGFANGIVSGIKSALGIHSPSRVMADVVGKNMVLGIGQGFADNMQGVTQSMTDNLHKSISGLATNIPVTATIGGQYAGSATANAQHSESTIKNYFNDKFEIHIDGGQPTRQQAESLMEQMEIVRKRRAVAYGTT